jgi:hypothetical protein
VDTNSFRWVYVNRYPVEQFLLKHCRGYSTRRRAWIYWWKKEVLENENYYLDLYSCFSSNPFSFDPVIIARFCNGTFDIADGWHRVAVAIVHRLSYIPAVVGIEQDCP